MIKLVQFLFRNKNLLFVILASPIVAVFFISKSDLELLPSSPYLEFHLIYDVPHNPALSIAERVATPSERILNGLPHLISMVSHVEHETLKIILKFSDKIAENEVYLNIQEKLDLIHLAVPRDVQSIRLVKLNSLSAPNYRLFFKEPLSISSIAKQLYPFQVAIQKSEPPLENHNRVSIEPKMDLLYKMGLPLSQVHKAIRSVGLSAFMGERRGVLYSSGSNFESLDDLRSLVVGVKDTRPIQLREVAQINIEPMKKITELELWINDSRLEASDFEQQLSSLFPGVQWEQPKYIVIKNQLKQPLVGLAVLLFLQLVLMRMIFGPKFSWRSVLVFYTLCITHYFFWKYMVYGKVNVLDAHGLLIVLTLGGVLLTLLFVRIRNYFIVDYKKYRPSKTGEQASLFAQLELMPMYLVACVVLCLMQFPLLVSKVNLPSYHLVLPIVTVGMPVLLVILLIMPILGGLGWLESDHRLPRWSMQWKEKTLRFWVFAVVTVLLLPVTVYLFNSLSLTVVEKNLSQDVTENLTQLRGHSAFVNYSLSSDNDFTGLEGVYVTERENKIDYHFELHGLRMLAQTDFLGFIEALKAVSAGEYLGSLLRGAEKLPIYFSPSHLSDRELRSSLLQADNKNEPNRSLGSLTTTRYLSEKNRITRIQLAETNVVRVAAQKGDLRFKEFSQVKPTPWTQFLLSLLGQYEREHFFAISFVFVILSLYLNSFVRAFLVCLFCVFALGIFLLLHFLIFHGFHLDSLWMLPFSTWILLLVTLYLTRVIDVERTRGQDRLRCIAEVKTYLAPVGILTSILLGLSFIFLGMLDLIPGMQGLGLWHEGVFVGVLCVLLSLVYVIWLFPIFYISSEREIDRLAFKFFQISKKFRPG